MASMFSLGEPYKSTEEASKGVRNSVLGLLFIIVVQSAMGLFVWYGSTLNTKEIFSGWPNFDGLILLILAAVLLYRFSRTAAIILLALAVLRLVGHWAATGFGSPPGISLLIVGAAAQVAVVAFKAHAWEKSNQKLRRPKWGGSALAATTIVMLGALVFPPVHLFSHINKNTSLTENGNTITFHDAGDMYSVSFPATWQKVRPHDDFYGSVAFTPVDNGNVRVEVERWQPYSIAPVALFTADAFLKMAQDEAAAYAGENSMTADAVEMLEPSNINKARAAFTGPDGSKKYLYYIYDKAWSRQTSDAIFFFWRITVDVPKDSLQYDKEAQTVAASFTVGQSQ